MFSTINVIRIITFDFVNGLLYDYWIKDFVKNRFNWFLIFVLINRCRNFLNISGIINIIYLYKRIFAWNNIIRIGSSLWILIKTIIEIFEAEKKHFIKRSLF